MILKSLINLVKTQQLFGCQDISDLCLLYVQNFNGNAQRYGTRTAVKLAKALYNESVRYSAGLVVLPLSEVWMKRDKDQYVLTHKSFRRPLRGGLLDRRMALSILRVFEILELPVLEDLKTVTSPSKGRIGFASMQAPWEHFLRVGRFAHQLRKMLSEELIQKGKGIDPVSLHLSTKKGVKGPTAATAGLQSLAIDPILLQNLGNIRSAFLPKEKWMDVVIANQELHRVRPDITGNLDKAILTTTKGRIAFIADGVKTRTIAIGNYWIQDALKPLHRAVYKILRKIPTDGTYDQTSQFERVRMNSSICGVWSFDLTAATDRFPIEPQISLLKSLNREIGSNWSTILQDFEFLFKDKTYKYEVGQPMGLYSSWAIFALTHHAVIQFCAFQEKVPYPFEDYAVLGDDVAIWNPAIAKRYTKLLHLLDVTISEQKSFIPEFPDKPCVAEFAKRISVKGLELSPISPSQNDEAWKSFYAFPGFLDWLENHGFETGSIPVSRVTGLMGLNPHQTRNFVCSLRVWELLRGPFGLTFAVPEEINRYVNKVTLLNLRITLLQEQTSEVNFYIDNDRAALENCLMGPIPDNHYFLLILKTRLRDLWELVARLQDLLYIAEELEGQGEEDFKFPPLSELEYIPFASFADVLNSVIKSPSRRKQKGTYVQSLVKRALLHYKSGNSDVFRIIESDSTIIMGLDGPED